MMTRKPESEVQHQRKPSSSSTRLKIQGGMLCLLGTALVSGCVSTDQYQTEKGRALNFQRLLAQEEQRTSELNAQLQEKKQEVASLKEKNRELTVERDLLRDQVRRQQDSAQSSDLPAPSSDLTTHEESPFSDPSLSEFELSNFPLDESGFNDLSMGETESGGLGTPTYYYTVVKGDTLYRISREYGVTIDQLKEWNNLTDNTISIGQQLIVSPR